MTAAEKSAPTVRRTVAPSAGIAAALILIGVAFAVPPLFGWHVNALGRAPLSARWDPRVGRGTVPAVALALAAARWAPTLAVSLRWSRLLLGAFAASLLWAASLAMVDGTRGIGGILGNSGEYLQTAHRVHDVPTLLHGFVSRIPLTSHDNWPTHVAGHPPGALLFFVLLVHLGVGSGLAAGWTVVVITSSTAPAVLITLRRLGAEQQARHAAPFLVFGPSAIWLAVSADAMFAAVAAWGLCCLALAATSAGPSRRSAWSLLSGVVLGYCCFLSYGLPLLAVLAAAIVVLTRQPRVLLAGGVGVLAVVAAFALGGFTWWHAYPVLRSRYYAGIADRRPASYWLWGDLAARASAPAQCSAPR